MKTEQQDLQLIQQKYYVRIRADSIKAMAAYFVISKVVVLMQLIKSACFPQIRYSSDDKMLNFRKISFYKLSEWFKIWNI